MKDLKGSMAPLEKQTVLNRNCTRNSSLVGFSCACYMTSGVMEANVYEREERCSHPRSFVN